MCRLGSLGRAWCNKKIAGGCRMNALFYALLHELVKFQYQFYNSKRKNKASIKPTIEPSLKVILFVMSTNQKKMPFQSCSSWYLGRCLSYCSRIFKLSDIIIDDVLILSDLVGFLCIFAFFCNFTFHSTLGIVTKKLCNKNMIFKQSMIKIRPFYNIVP